MASQPSLRVVSNCILGSTIAALEPFNLSEPVYLILGLQQQHGLRPVQPAWWDPRANNGLGAWQPDYCRLMRARRESAVFSCHRLGHYALVAEAAHLLEPRGDRTVVHTHPAVYAGTGVAVLSLACSLVVYSLGYPGIGMSRKLKHSLPNFWLSLIFLLVLYTLVGELESSPGLCKTLGLLLHYFILTSSLWLTISSSILHGKLINPTDQVIKRSNPYVVNPEHEVYMVGEGGIRLRRPVARFYLAGWGVPLIICGITGGAGLPQYSAAGWCFLAPALAAGAVMVPFLLTTVVHLYFILSILTFSPEMRHYSHSLLAGRRQESQASLCTQSTLMVPDTERSARSQALVLLASSVLLMAALAAAALATTTPLSSLSTTTQTTLFSWLYALVTTSLGLATLTYYCCLRGDLLCRLPQPCSSPEETSNLINLTDLAARRQTTKTVQMEKNLAPYSSLPVLDQPEPQPWLGGSVLGPSSGRVKQCNVERGDSEVSSDYHSINNAAHLRRPKKSAYPGLSDTEAQRSVSDLLGQYQASKMKISNVNIHANDGMNKVAWSSGWEGPPSLASPLELPCPDLASFYLPPRDPLPRSSSLPRRGRSSQSRERWRGSRGQAAGLSDWERLAEVCSTSRHSEVSSSTAPSHRSRASQGR